ncbi:MAG: OsmC family protein [Nocardioides sp.]
MSQSETPPETLPESLPETLRSIDLVRIGEGRYKATNGRGGVLPVGSGDDPDFTPVELLLAAIAGCGAIDVDLITGKRARATQFAVCSEGHKVRDEDGNHLVDLRVTFDLTFPEGEAGDRAREILPRALQQTRDRLCTVGRTVALGEPVEYVDGSGA